MATHSRILTWRIPMDRGAWRATIQGVAKGRILLSDKAQHSADSKEVLLSSFYTRGGQTMFCRLSLTYHQFL